MLVGDGVVGTEEGIGETLGPGVGSEELGAGLGTKLGRFVGIFDGF